MRKECNGLYLCEVPTGIGKSYQAAHAMEEYVKEIREEYAKAMRQCARTITDERKLIYLTPLRKNVGEEEEELKKAYENEELFEKEVLHIKSNVDNIIENLGKVTIPQDKQPFNYDELKKQVKAYNGESSPEIKKIWEDKVEEEERKFRKEIKNTLSVIPARERLERIKNDKQYQWIGQLYPVVFIKEKKIILMTISKFLSKNISLVDKSVTFFDSDISKNAVIFMDEFDSTKEFVRNHIIQNSFKSNDDYLDVFRQIASNMDLTNFDRYVTEAETRIDEDGTKYEKFCDRAKKIMEDYKLNLNYKTVLEQDDLKQLFIFHDGQINTICKKNFLVVGIENMVKNRIDIQQVDEKEEINGAISISALLKDIHDFLRDFRFFLLKWAEQYATVVNIYRQKTETPMDILQEDNALSSLMGCFKLNVDQQKLVYDEADKIKIELKSKKEDFYQTGFEYYRFVDADRHNHKTDINFVSIRTTPEKILLAMARKASVIGMSASAEFKTVLNNYNLDYLKEELGPDYHITESALKTEIAAELVKRNIPYKNKEIKCHGFRISAERNYFENKECRKILVQKIKNEISDSDKQGSYKQNRYLAIANVFHIFCTSNMRTLLCLENILAEEGKEKWDTTVLNGLLDSAKEDTDYRGDDIEIIVMNSKNFKNKKKEFKEKLNKHKRVIIISSYKTLAEGQNLQYNVKDTEGLIRLPGKRKGKEKDLDGIYLGEITYIIRRSIDSGQPFDRNERNKNISEQIFQAEDLFVQSEIGKTDKDKWIKEAFLGENKSKQYNLKSIGVSITRTVLQAVGRLCRTTLKSPDIYILVNENVLKKMNVDDLNIKESQCLFPPEMLKILELKEEYNRDKERAKEDSIKEAWEEAREEANKSSFRSLDWINDFLENCWKLIEQRNWIEMREWVLKYPTLYDEAKLPDNILNEFYFHIPGRKKKYYFKAYNDFQDGVEVSFADKSNCRGWSEMSEKAAKLPYILKYKGMKEYFKKKGYVTSFKMLPRILNPVMFRNIYKGALGEVAGRFIIENELGIKLIDITEPEKFEKFDFRLNEEVYVDFKNWDESMQVDRENELKKIRQKMRMVGAKRVYIINIVVEDGTKYEIKESTDGIIEIPGLITKNGDIITKPIEKLAKEVK